MSKYIIELDENAKEVVVISLEDGDMWTETMEVEDLEQLNSDYINEHFSDLQDTAYQRGLDDAWECAKKLFSTMSNTEIEKVFPTEWENGFRGLMQMKPQYAIAKLKAYEEKQKADDEIKVGDEVRHKEYKNRFVVTKMQDGHVYGISKDGSWNNFRNDWSIVKTGRHFDIQKILEAMKHD